MTDETNEDEASTVLGGQNERLVMWLCGGCGQKIPKSAVEPYGDGHCHVIPVEIAEGEWEPQPYGPVNKTDT